MVERKKDTGQVESGCSGTEKSEGEMGMGRE